MDMQSFSTLSAKSEASVLHAHASADIADTLASPPDDMEPPASALGWLAMDEVDYGIVLLSCEGEVLHANRRARADFEAGGHALSLTNGWLKARCSQDSQRLAEALGAAGRGLRCLVEIDRAGERTNVALVPLLVSPGQRPAAVLLLMGRRRICENLSVQSFARANNLTLAEARVLEALCAGETAGMLARRQGVSLSTVRTHIASIRMKTCTRSLQELVRRVAGLPPLVSVLRMSS